MSFIATGGVVAGLVTVGAGAYEASQANSAAKTQAGAALNAQQISQNEFNTITQQEQPFIQSGYGALSNLDYLLGIPGPSSNAPNAAPSINPNVPVGGNSISGGFGMTYPGVGQPAVGQTGVDPSSGFRLGPGGQITRGLAGGSPAAAGSAPAGQSVPGGYGSLLAPFTADTFKQYSPAYQFQLQQGGQGVLNADASGQGALSGATMKDLIGYNQNLANTSFNNAFNQYQTQQGNIFQRLSGIAQLGQSAASNTGQQGTALAGQAAQSATNVGTALAAGQIGSANAIGGTLTSALPWLMYGGGESAGVGGG